MRGFLSTDAQSSEIKKIGFSCVRCGICCIEEEKGSNLVMVSPAEIRNIMALTEEKYEDIAEPFPEWVQDKGKRFTFGWVIRRVNGECKYLERMYKKSEKRAYQTPKNRQFYCRIYQARPWICRTYPFLIEDGKLIHDTCPGIGDEISKEASCQIASDLTERVKYESNQEERIYRIFRTFSYDKKPINQPVVIDDEGVKHIYE